jgi:hypothetical protein
MIWLVLLVLLLDDELLVHLVPQKIKSAPPVTGGALENLIRQAQLPDDALVSVLLLCLLQVECCA